MQEFDGIAIRLRHLSKRESEFLLLEHLEWLEGDVDRRNLIFKKASRSVVLIKFLEI